MKFRHRLRTIFDDSRYRSLRLNKSTLLNGSIILIFRQLLKRFQIGELRSEFLVDEGFVDADALPDDWFIGFELAIVAAIVLRSASFCARWPIERSEIGAVFFRLPEPEIASAWRRDPRSHRRGLKRAFRIIVVALARRAIVQYPVARRLGRS